MKSGLLGLGRPQFGIDDPTQQAIDRYASMPAPPQAPQSQGMSWADKLSNLGSSFAAAQAAFDGDVGGSEAIFQSIGAPQRQAQAAQLKRLQDWEDWQRQYEYERNNPKPQQVGPTELQRNYAWYDSLSPAEKQRVNQFEDVHNPRFTNTAAGTQFVPRGAMSGGWQSQYDPNEWEVVPGPQQGGAGSPAPQGFRTDIPSGSPLDPWPPRRR